jgi:hypothetical protein
MSRRNAKRVQTLRFKVSDSKFAVVAEGVYDRKIEFIRAGNDGVQANPPAVHLLAPLAQAHLSLRANAFGSMAKKDFLAPSGKHCYGYPAQIRAVIRA